ncbi:MAG: aminodeoxychorismate synthase component I [Syntrophothermus sp.]
MKYLDRRQILDKINHYASAERPFLFAIDFDGEKGFVLTSQEAREMGILYSSHNSVLIPDNRKPFSFNFLPPEKYQYLQAFNKVKQHIFRGDTYLLNLTFPTVLDTSLTLEEIFYRSSAKYKLLVPDNFVVFSPETFVFTRNRMIFSNPMKGTISADTEDAENVLLSDEKELFEHNTIVDLIRNDLSMVATHVEVSRFRYIERICSNRGDIFQMSSEIRGILPEDFPVDLGSLILKLLPAGSVTGAPKEKTVDIIRETENYSRGFYTGIFGFFDGKNLDSAVSIRFIERDRDDHLIFKSGGGITALSDALMEYKELITKIYVPII